MKRATLLLAVGLALPQMALLGWGADYWLTPFAARAAHPQHALLAAGAGGGQALGLLGLASMLALLAYSAAKMLLRSGRTRSTGATLTVHVALGLFGPLCILEHCGLRFRGLAGVAAALMVGVLISGVAGRLLRGRLVAQADAARARAGEPMTLLLRASAGGVPEEPDAPDPEVARLVAAVAALPPPPGQAWRWLPYELRLAALSREVRGARLAEGLNPEVQGLLRAELQEHMAARRRIARADTAERLLGWWRTAHVAASHGMYALALLHAASALLFADTVGRLRAAWALVAP